MNKKNALLHARRLLLTAFLLVVGMGLSNAQTFSFNNNVGDHLWSNAGNWADGLKPSIGNGTVVVIADVIVDEDAVIQSLYDSTICDLTVQAGKKLTVVDQIVWNKGGNIILEDAAQLVTDHPQILTVKKSITALADCINPWYVIASPLIPELTPSIENGFLTEPETAYGLYAFDEATLEFVDFKETPFSLVNGKGYLYANAFDTTLLFSGMANGSSAPMEVPLEYHSVIGIATGCNLVGNPFPCNAYSNKSYYLVTGPDNMLLPVTASSARALKPCEGVFIKADSANETIAFGRNPDSQPTQNQGYIVISASKASVPDTLLDQAVISFNPNDNLGKYVINTDLPRISFSQNDRDMAIISIDSTDAISVKFKVSESGSYTLNFHQKELEINYLHLIDNLTGTNTDLLASPNYTFTASPNDYASRFKLVFNPHYGVEENLHQAFAYYANGEIRFVTDVGTASLQVIDMTGRVVHSADAMHCVSTNGIPAGFYILRLTDGENVWTQKIVID